MSTAVPNGKNAAPVLQPWFLGFVDGLEGFLEGRASGVQLSDVVVVGYGNSADSDEIADKKEYFKMTSRTPGKSDPEIASVGGNGAYISHRSRVFGIYRTAEEAESAVDRLLQSGLTPKDIAVLLAENESTREFARRKGTRPPAGTAHGGTASLPLDGTFGLRDPRCARDRHQSGWRRTWCAACRSKPDLLPRDAARQPRSRDFAAPPACRHRQ